MVTATRVAAASASAVPSGKTVARASTQPPSAGCRDSSAPCLEIFRSPSITNTIGNARGVVQASRMPMKRKAWLAGWPSPLGGSGITEKVHASAASSGVRLMPFSFSCGAAAAVAGTGRV